MFISVCGLEGASKTTSINTINEVFVELTGQLPWPVREPGGTPLGEILRNLFKHRDPAQEHITNTTELLILFAAREQLYHNVIRPNIAKHNIVADRSWWCSYAYQVFQLPSSDPLHSLFWQLHEAIVSQTPHDFVLYLDIDPAVGLERARGRGALDSIEQRALPFFTKAREGYQQLALSHDNCTTIDSGRSLDEVQADVRAWATKVIGSAF
jgi:dTMP kinase